MAESSTLPVTLLNTVRLIGLRLCCVAISKLEYLLLCKGTSSNHSRCVPDSVSGGVDVVCNQSIMSSFSSPEARTTFRASTCGIVCRAGVSGVLFALFGYALATQFNDESSVLYWILFYFALASLSAAVVTYTVAPTRISPRARFVCKQVAMGMCGWAAVLSITTGLRLRNVEGGGETEGGDNDHATAREEILNELSGALLGFLTGLWYLFEFSYPVVDDDELDN